MRIRPEIAALPAYKQGRQAGADAFKLSSNENPFEPLPSVVAAVQTAVAFNRYPDATASRLRARLAERYGVGDDAVHIAAGSVSILYQLTQATCPFIRPARASTKEPVHTPTSGTPARDARCKNVWVPAIRRWPPCSKPPTTTT